MNVACDQGRAIYKNGFTHAFVHLLQKPSVKSLTRLQTNAQKTKRSDFLALAVLYFLYISQYLHVCNNTQDSGISIFRL